jgi:osmotically inducible lipoprotein OsmB
MISRKSTLSSIGAAAMLSLLLGGCGSMSTQDKGTIAGAGVGAAGGALLGGNAAATVGGAAVGGLIGREVSKDKD